MPEEKIFTIPLRKAWRTSRNRRAKKATILIEEFLERHMNGEVKIGKSINESVWSRGIQKPPRRIRVHATKEGEAVYAELVGIEIKKPTPEDLKKKEEKKKEKEKKIKEGRKKKKTLEEEIKEEKAKAERPRAEIKEEKIEETEAKEEKVKKE